MKSLPYIFLFALLAVGAAAGFIWCFCEVLLYLVKDNHSTNGWAALMFLVCTTALFPVYRISKKYSEQDAELIQRKRSDEGPGRRKH